MDGVVFVYIFAFFVVVRVFFKILLCMILFTLPDSKAPICVVESNFPCS